MTTVANDAPTLVGSYIDLLNKLHNLLKAHPAGSAVRLLFVPEQEQLELEADEVLVQLIEQRTIKLIPQRIADLSPTDIVHETQLVDPGDGSFNTYANSLQGGNCTTYYSNKGCNHAYGPKK